MQMETNEEKETVCKIGLTIRLAVLKRFMLLLYLFLWLFYSVGRKRHGKICFGRNDVLLTKHAI